MKRHRSAATLITSLAIGGLACSDEGTGGGVEFRIEQPVLPGFELDTGLMPAGSQAQVRALATATGSLVAQAKADAAENELQPVAGSGRLELGAEIKLEVYAKLDLGAVQFDEKVADVSIAAPAADTAFEPFLLDETATVTSTLEPGELLRVPLGAVPGSTLVLSLARGSLAAEFAGSCATVHEGAAQYRGAVTWSGALDLSATIEVDVPPLGKQSFGPLAVAVPIAPFTTDLDLGVVDLATGAPAMPAVPPCEAAPGNGGDSGDAGAGGGDDDDDGTGGPDAGSDIEPPPPSSLWSLEIVSAHAAAIPCDGMQWDTDGSAPDLVVVFVAGNGFYRTTMKSNSYDPTYNETLGTWEASDLLDEDGSIFIVEDRDPDGTLEDVGLLSYVFGAELFDGAPHVVEDPRDCDTDSAGMRVTFRLIPED